ncbi:unnamed protein product [Vitrella brassicaformis CCMP3155]|uniref:EF-hand domain-containing protein n=1 Tax=Vitrella brassicaformis (strain CCMP3155) TaxID=1169540 RepID=A0A0G4GKW0_VITBC|nr:unnamed protein product [Vitrella brassicaformis CCMP3155]|eukprot:CEM30632.1 unnamed protein product [Vitrella brassicaformis CCMP3155]
MDKDGNGLLCWEEVQDYLQPAEDLAKTAHVQELIRQVEVMLKETATAATVEQADILIKKPSAKNLTEEAEKVLDAPEIMELVDSASAVLKRQSATNLTVEVRKYLHGESTGQDVENSYDILMAEEAGKNLSSAFEALIDSETVDNFVKIAEDIIENPSAELENATQSLESKADKVTYANSTDAVGDGWEHVVKEEKKLRTGIYKEIEDLGNDLDNETAVRDGVLVADELLTRENINDLIDHAKGHLRDSRLKDNILQNYYEDLKKDAANARLQDSKPVGDYAKIYYDDIKNKYSLVSGCLLVSDAIKGLGATTSDCTDCPDFPLYSKEGTKPTPPPPRADWDGIQKGFDQFRDQGEHLPSEADGCKQEAGVLKCEEATAPTFVKLSPNSPVQNVKGTSQPDEIIGSTSDNELDGGEGTDILNGGGGNDKLTGGAGNDLFVMSDLPGTSTVTDFTPGTDQLDLRGFQISDPNDLDFAEGSVIIKIDEEHQMVLEGVSRDQLSLGDYMLVAADPTASTQAPEESKDSGAHAHQSATEVAVITAATWLLAAHYIAA